VRGKFYQDHNIQEKRNFKGFNDQFNKVIIIVFIANLLCNPLRFLCATFIDIIYSSEEEEFTNRIFIFIYSLPFQEPDPDQLALRQQPCSKSQEEMGEEAEAETEAVEETGADRHPLPTEWFFRTSSVSFPQKLHRLSTLGTARLPSSRCEMPPRRHYPQSGQLTPRALVGSTSM
jgi:hypothetical protein